MLNFVFGRSGYGKTEYCFNEIKNLVDCGKNNIVLVTPEQFNFTAEKKLLNMLGESGIKNVRNLSFSRLVNEVSKYFGGSPYPVLSSGAKAALMKKAVDSVSDRLVLYGKKTGRPAFINSMLEIHDEMISCCISPNEMRQLSKKLSDKKLLADKLTDMSLILHAYDELLEKRFLDPASNLSRLYDMLLSSDYLKGKTVFVDGFNGFVADEYRILKLMIKYADSITVTLCTDVPENQDKYNLFAYVNNTAKTLKRAAEECNIEVNTLYLKQNYRAKNDFMRFCERQIYSESPTIYKGDCNAVIYRAEDVNDECDYTALTIRHELEKGMKASDIAVICRDMNKYRSRLSYSFRKYGVPYFDDERQDINSQPIIVFIMYLLRSVIYSFRSDDILSLAKTGLTVLTQKKINLLENYIYVWSITGVGKWNTEFTNSPKGYTSQLSESEKLSLESLNKSREYLVSNINKFKFAAKGANAKEIGTAIYQALISFGADKQLIKLAAEIRAMNKNELANEQQRVWELAMGILNDITRVCGEDKITLSEYYDLFCIMAQSEDLGVLPQGIDNVQFGEADRFRADNPRIVFILGANENEFPQNIKGTSLLNENDRAVLSQNDFELYSYGDILNIQEKYFAYMAASIASEKVYISYGGSGNNDAPSSLVTSVLSMLGNDYEPVQKADIPDVLKIGSYQSAFELMAKKFEDNTEFSESLKYYFRNDPRFKAVENICLNKAEALSNAISAEKLFGKNMFLSASRVEDFFNCKFRYFCKFGLMARPRMKAELNAMETGTAIHAVLEGIIKDIGSKKLSEMPSVQIHILVDKYLSEYLETQFGNSDELTKRFKYQFMRLSRMLNFVVERLAGEFSQTDFEAAAFELKIDKDGEAQPYVIPLENGSVSIRGSIDRVDTLDKNGEKYVRVIDYKSGTKEFNLSDVLYGLNLQMFVYLFAVCNDKKCKVNGIPAGVLYMHVSKKSIDVGKKNIEADVEKSNSEFKMKGVVLYDDEHDIVASMEKDLKGKYIPFKFDSSNNPKGCFASYEELGKIAKKINNLIAQMGNDLHSGKIEQNPIYGAGHDNTCEFCDYYDVCSIKKEIKKREIEKLADEQVVKILEEEQE